MIKSCQNLFSYIRAKFHLSQSGQGILEVIVTIGIGTIMIMALVVLSIRTNRSSDFSKASSQASNLASEGIEIITNLKELNGTDTTLPLPDTNLFKFDGTSCSGDSTTDINWDSIFGIDIDDDACPAGSLFGRIGYIIDSCSNGYSCVYFKDSDPSLGEKIIDSRTYQRTVYIADTPLGSTPPGKSNCNTNDDTDPNVGDWDNIKQFTVVVSWIDSSGTHNQTQTACLQR